MLFKVLIYGICTINILIYFYGNLFQWLLIKSVSDSLNITLLVCFSMFLTWERDVSFSYLFWVQQGHGVHRVDLAEFKLPRERAIQRILTLDLVSSIAIDYLRYRMFFPNESSNTMMSSALDGTDIIDIRHNTQNPDFINVKSLTYHQVAALSVYLSSTDSECIVSVLSMQQCVYVTLTLSVKVKVLQ